MKFSTIHGITRKYFYLLHQHPVPSSREKSTLILIHSTRAWKSHFPKSLFSIIAFPQKYLSFSLSLLPFTPSIHISDHFPFPSSSFSFISFYTVFITAFIDRHGSRDTNWIALPYQMPRVRQIEILFSSFFFFPFFSLSLFHRRLFPIYRPSTPCIVTDDNGEERNGWCRFDDHFNELLQFPLFQLSPFLLPFVSSVSTCN